MKKNKNKILIASISTLSMLFMPVMAMTSCVSNTQKDIEITGKDNIEVVFGETKTETYFCSVFDYGFKDDQVDWILEGDTADGKISLIEDEKNSNFITVSFDKWLPTGKYDITLKAICKNDPDTEYEKNVSVLVDDANSEYSEFEMDIYNYINTFSLSLGITTKNSEGKYRHEYYTAWIFSGVNSTAENSYDYYIISNAAAKYYTSRDGYDTFTQVSFGFTNNMEQNSSLSVNDDYQVVHIADDNPDIPDQFEFLYDNYTQDNEGTMQTTKDRRDGTNTNFKIDALVSYIDFSEFVDENNPYESYNPDLKAKLDRVNEELSSFDENASYDAKTIPFADTFGLTTPKWYITDYLGDELEAYHTIFPDVNADGIRNVYFLGYAQESYPLSEHHVTNLVYDKAEVFNGGIYLNYADRYVDPSVGMHNVQTLKIPESPNPTNLSQYESFENEYVLVNNSLRDFTTGCQGSIAVNENKEVVGILWGDYKVDHLGRTQKSIASLMGSSVKDTSTSTNYVEYDFIYSFYDWLNSQP